MAMKTAQLPEGMGCFYLWLQVHYDSTWGLLLLLHALIQFALLLWGPAFGMTHIRWLVDCVNLAEERSGARLSVALSDTLIHGVGLAGRWVFSYIRLFHKSRSFSR